MFEVECPSCKAGYQVDERRVPPKGLKMRCPKCGHSFQVDRPGEDSGPVLGAALGLGARNVRKTMVGVAPSASPVTTPSVQNPTSAQASPAQASPAQGSPAQGNSAQARSPQASPGAGPPKPGALKSTMIGVAPAGPSRAVAPAPVSSGAPRPGAPRVAPPVAPRVAPSRARATSPGAPRPAVGSLGQKPPPRPGGPPRPGASSRGPLAPGLPSVSLADDQLDALDEPDFEADLPMPREPSLAPAARAIDELESLAPESISPDEDDDSELDLPSLARSAEPDELDLPAPVTQASRAALHDTGALEDAGALDDADELELGHLAAAGFPDSQGDLPAPLPLSGEFDFGAVSGDRFDDDRAADLPAPARLRDADLPAPAPRRAANLPAPAGPREIDLPSVPPPSGDADLPLRVPAPGEVDLPSPSGGSGPGDSFDADLPSLEADLPSPSARLPSRNEMDLPAPAAGLPKVGGVGLPSPSAELPDLAAGLPTDAASLPASGGELPDLSSDLEPGGEPAKSESIPSLPADGPASTPRSDFEDPFPSAKAQRPPAGSPPRPEAFGEIDFGSGDAADDFGGGFSDGPLGGTDIGGPASGGYGDTDLGGDAAEFDAFPTEATNGGAKAASATGEAGWGEVTLSGDTADLDLDEEPSRGLAPSQRPLAGSPAEAIRPGESGAPTAILPKEKKGFSRGSKIGVGVVLVAAIAGGALSMLPEYGPYGAYKIIDTLKADEYQARLTEVQREASELLGKDVNASAAAAFDRAEAAHQGARRFKPLAAYAAYLGYARQLRFGNDAPYDARAKVLLDSLEESSPDEVELLRMARVARDAAAGQTKGAFERAKAMLRESPGFEEAALAGEVSLAAREPNTALVAWQAAAKEQDSARTAFGLARTHFALGDEKSAIANAQKAVEKNPEHSGARLLLARLQLDDRSKDDELVKALETFTQAGATSQGERLEAFVLLGNLHMARSRIAKAETAYKQALEIDGASFEALRGLGDSLFAAGRFSEALARYEAVQKIRPDDVSALLGIARCKLQLEKLQDAAGLLETLRKKHPESVAVAALYGRSKEMVGDRKEAAEAYRAAIKEGDDVPELIDAYIGLTRILQQQGRTDEAAKEIDKAVKRFPDRPEVYIALGDLALAQARYERAVEDYDRALKLDADNVGIHFKRGIALRRARRYEEAFAEFDLVKKGDPDNPNLALELGLAYESAGEAEEALAQYEAALERAPDDLDLKLRVGCGKAGAGQTKAAEELLVQVLEARPNSAEANHCLGRAILFGEGETRLTEARRLLKRAVVLDANTAVYHLYVGWAANEAQDTAEAESALTRALELDQSLADAYWQRGLLRVRQGAAVNAIEDLDRSLELSPSRYEAYAGLADAYYDRGMEPEAMAAWDKAITLGPPEPVWHLRYGRLLFDNRRVPEARKQFELAVEKASKVEPAPRWLWEAHRLLATSIGRHPDAIEHWQKFVVNADKSSPYLPEAMRELKALGGVPR